MSPRTSLRRAARSRRWSGFAALLFAVALVVQPALASTRGCGGAGAAGRGVEGACCCALAVPEPDAASPCCASGNEERGEEGREDPAPASLCLCPSAPGPAGPQPATRDAGQGATTKELVERLAARSADALVPGAACAGPGPTPGACPPAALRRCGAPPGELFFPVGPPGTRLASRGAPGLLAALGIARL